MDQVKARWTLLTFGQLVSHLVPVDIVGVVVEAVAGVDWGGPVRVCKQYCLQQRVLDQARLPFGFRVYGLGLRIGLVHAT